MNFLTPFGAIFFPLCDFHLPHASHLYTFPCWTRCSSPLMTALLILRPSQFLFFLLAEDRSLLSPILMHLPPPLRLAPHFFDSVAAAIHAGAPLPLGLLDHAPRFSKVVTQASFLTASWRLSRSKLSECGAATTPPPRYAFVFGIFPPFTNVDISSDPVLGLDRFFTGMNSLSPPAPSMRPCPYVSSPSPYPLGPGLFSLFSTIADCRRHPLPPPAPHGLSCETSSYLFPPPPSAGGFSSEREAGTPDRNSGNLFSSSRSCTSLFYMKFPLLQQSL